MQKCIISYVTFFIIGLIFFTSSWKKEAWSDTPHRRWRSWENPKSRMEITVHAKRVEPLHFTCFFVENFSGFHLQDKHNASNLPKCRDESFGSSLQMYNLIPKYLQCFRKILQVCNKFIVCVEFLQSMCRRTEMDTCNFCNEDLCFFSRPALIILPNSCAASM